MDARTRLRLVGQADLGEWIEVATGGDLNNPKLWRIQRDICRALSKPHAQVAVPSCNSSGKTHLAGRIALAFFDCFQPGTPCLICGEAAGLPRGEYAPCGGVKVITTSSKADHLENNLWGELRSAYAVIARRVGFPGRLLPKAMMLDGGPQNFIIGQTTNTAEGLQGYHQAHKLILGDEATSVDDEVQAAITGLLASGDARMLLIFNPTDDTTYAARVARSPKTETIKITAFDTPAFTGEHMPDGANLTSPAWLEMLKAMGMGPGTYEWETRVLANFWSLGEGQLIPAEWVDRNWRPNTWREQEGGVVQLGVDLAAYGTDENVIWVRWGDDVVDFKAFPSMRPDLFFQGPVREMVVKWGAAYLCYDGDGVGAGVIGEAMRIQESTGCRIIPFRGAKSLNDYQLNARATWWWNLRRRFENNLIKIRVPDDPKTREQLSNITYSIPQGKIRVETKDEMKKRGVGSPDRADGLVYCFAVSEGTVQEFLPPQPTEQQSETITGTMDLSERAMWLRVQDGYRRPKQDINAVTGVPDDY